MLAAALVLLSIAGGAPSAAAGAPSTAAGAPSTIVVMATAPACRGGFAAPRPAAAGKDGPQPKKATAVPKP